MYCFLRIDFFSDPVSGPENFRDTVAANKLIYAMLTHRGRVRRVNEDACAAAPTHGVFVVCDGMGGAAGGEIASHLAAETFLAHLSNAAGNASGANAGSGANEGSANAGSSARTRSSARMETRLKAAVEAANEAVYRQARHSPQLAGMGTTLVGLLHAPLTSAGPEGGRSANNHTNSRASDPPTLWLAHVGDSRCYLRRRGRLMLLTTDHSLVEEQVRAGQITPQQAAESPMRNLITRAVGSQATVEPEIQGYNPLPGDLYLLASDGLNRELSDEAIEEVLMRVPEYATERSLNAACKALVNAANECGGGDNVTVVLVALQPQ
ncbi:MAG TPA: protein phosphatase 2C domain-containing protein [Edaphobacter sp.]